ncbi:unnamed protein product, partial [Ascophyllum nodosum]
RSRHDAKTKKHLLHKFIFECGKHMEMKTLVMAAAATICQRYYAQRSLRDIPTYHVGSAALLIASKAEEFPRKMKEVLMAAYAVGYKTESDRYLNSQKYEADASKMASAERVLMC